MNKTVARMLGESADVPDVEQTAPAATPEVPARLGYSNPTVEQLVQLWKSGQHEAVALRVLDALDHYADFMELAFQIGHEDALQLGQIMDSMTSEEVSPHEYDVIPDEEVELKFGKRPAPGDTHTAAGE